MTWLCIHRLHTLSDPLSPSRLSLHPYHTKSSSSNLCHHGDHLPIHQHNNLLPSTPTHPQPTMYLSSPSSPPLIHHIELVLIATTLVAECFISHTITSLIKFMPSKPHFAQIVTLLFLAVAGVFGPVFAWGPVCKMGFSDEVLGPRYAGWK